jgi:1-acyl-sn-glycerol-3-phosphate acyltransferase
MSAAWWSPVAPCTPQVCVAGGGPLVGPLRRLVRYAAGLAVLLAGVAVSVPAGRWCRPARRDALIRWWVRAVTAAFGVHVVTPPMPQRRPAGVLVVSNHVSWLDILLVAAVCPGRMLAKREVAAWPVVGRLAVRGGTLFIDRERIRALPGTVAEIAEALRGGATVVAFPEGSTWCGREEGRFRPAVFQAALDAGVPVRPVVIRYRLAGGEPTTAPAFVGDDTLLASLRRVVATRGLIAEVTVDQEIPVGAYADRRALARAVRRAPASRP